MHYLFTTKAKPDNLTDDIRQFTLTSKGLQEVLKLYKEPGKKTSILNMGQVLNLKYKGQQFTIKAVF